MVGFQKLLNVHAKQLDRRVQRFVCPAISGTHDYVLFLPWQQLCVHHSDEDNTPNSLCSNGTFPNWPNYRMTSAWAEWPSEKHALRLISQMKMKPRWHSESPSGHALTHNGQCPRVLPLSSFTRSGTMLKKHEYRVNNVIINTGVVFWWGYTCVGTKMLSESPGWA